MGSGPRTKLAGVIPNVRSQRSLVSDDSERRYPPAQSVAVFGAEFFDPACACGCIAACALAIDRNKRRLDAGLHLAAVAAEEGDRPLL